MPDIIGIGFRPQDKWSKNDYNVFKAKDPVEVDKFTGLPVYKTAEQWEASGNGPKYEVWGLRDAKIFCDIFINTYLSNTKNATTFFNIAKCFYINPIHMTRAAVI